MWLTLVALIAAVVSTSGDGASTAPQAPLAVKVYAAQSMVAPGQRVDLIIELSGEEVRELPPPSITAERIVRVGKAAPSTTAARQEWARGMALVLQCEVPEGSPQRVLDYPTASSFVRDNGIGFLKVTVPPDAFEAGSCVLQVTLRRDGIVVGRSNSLYVACEGAPSHPVVR